MGVRLLKSLAPLTSCLTSRFLARGRLVRGRLSYVALQGGAELVLLPPQLCRLGGQGRGRLGRPRRRPLLRRGRLVVDALAWRGAAATEGEGGGK